MPGNTSHHGHGEPPEAAIRGENVPTENDAADRFDGAVDAVAGVLKTKEPYRDLTPSERERIARDYIKRLMDD